MMNPRGLRNNNPGNLRVSPHPWRGKVTVGKKDKKFEEFETVAYGYRALLITLRTYIRKYKLTTLRAIISRWAPPTENNTEMYVIKVASETGIPPGLMVKETDKEGLIKIACAISLVENGVPAVRADVEAGWNLI